MKVYVLLDQECGYDCLFEGVFKTRKQAEERMAEIIKDHPSCEETLYIEEYELSEDKTDNKPSVPWSEVKARMLNNPEVVKEIEKLDLEVSKVNKYPEHILKKLRQRLDLEPDDTSRDDEFNNQSPHRVFSEVTKWDGLLGSYDIQIKNWIRDIYGVDLDGISGK